MGNENTMSKSFELAQATPPATTDATPKPETAEEIVKEVASGLTPVLDYLATTAQNLSHQFLSYEGIYQITVIVVAGLIAWLLSKPALALIDRVWPGGEDENLFRSGVFPVVTRLIFPIVWVLGLWISVKVFRATGVGNDIVRTIVSLLSAWIVIRLFSSLVRDRMWSKTFAAIAWVIAALNILRLLNPTIALLDSIGMKVGDARLSLYLVIKGVILLALLLWLAAFLTRFVQSRVSRSTSLTPSVQTLIAQAVRIGLLFAAIMLAMNAIGVDLTALAVFSGAVGVGIGFGLQAIFSNMVAGIIMLLERSIKVGDFVELESGVTGEVREINIRSTLVTTNDNVDILVPNAEFINKNVTNWTLRDGFRRTKIPFGVAYGTDKDLVRKAVLEAAAEVPHMLTGRYAKDPQVWLTGFGDSALDFELVVWLSPESVKRPSAVNADYNWAIETALTKYGIEIPFPQRDLHLRSVDPDVTASIQSVSGKRSAPAKKK